MSECGVKACSEAASEAFDVFNPWGTGKFVSPGIRHPSVPALHYEVCDEHAAEFFPALAYIERDRSERIRDRIVPTPVSSLEQFET